MKRYFDYMDSVEVSDTLHERLINLEEPKKKPQPWAKWGAAAAALVLVAGIGAYGLSRGGWDAIMENFTPNAATARPENADIPAPGIAIVGPMSPPNDPDAPADRTNGGYEIVDGEMAVYYGLPWLEWADASALPQTSFDYSLAPLDAIQRDATWDDILLFMGGEKAMADHLLWDGLDWDGILWFLEDGTPCGASFSSGWVDGTHLYLEVMKGGKVPSCVVLPDEYYETSQWQGVKITALKNSGYMVTENSVELNEKREVSLYTNGTGYKLTLYAVDDGWADEVCARFVRYAVDGGFRLDALSADGVLDCSYYSVGEPNWEDIDINGDDVPDAYSGVEGFYCDCPDCINGTVHTHPYDPNAAAEAKAPTPPN